MEGNIFGCFVKIGFDPSLTEQDFTDLANTFRIYVWGENGICNALKKLMYEDYGKDLKLVLFQFYVKPTPFELQNLKEIENYRKREQSIGVPIVVNEENFFSLSEEERYNFLKQSIFNKLEVLAEVVKKKKLDTDVESLKIDLKKVLA